MNDKRFMQQVYDTADLAGRTAVNNLLVKGMKVVEYANPLDPTSEIINAYTVPDGVCGFAVIRIRPANCEFARFVTGWNYGHKSIQGGVVINVSMYNQCYQRKVAYADAFSAVLRHYGIRAYTESRLD